MGHDKSLGKTDAILLFGGGSDERLVSVASSQNLSAQYHFSELWYFSPAGRITRTALEDLRAHERPFEREFKPKGEAVAGSLRDALPLFSGRVAFLGFHGTEGEDGQIQALLEAAKIPFTGSGSHASARCFDKLQAKARVAQLGCRTAEHLEIDAAKPAELASKLNEFYEAHRRIVIKPVASGSSFGLFIAATPSELEKAISGITKLPYGRYLVEPFVEGRELTVGVWDKEGAAFALPASEVIMNAGHSFDYEGKYLGRGSVEVTPAMITHEEMSQAQKLAVQAHQALGCYGYSRTDMILTAQGPVYLETNTLPGMTRASFYPQQLAAAGLAMPNFVESQIQLAARRG